MTLVHPDGGAGETEAAPTRASSQLGLIALVQVLALAVWFSASAVLPQLRAAWDVGTVGSVLLTVAVQLGFVLGAVGSAMLGLADRYAPQRVLAAGAAVAAAATALTAAVVDGAGVGIALRLVTGAGLALVYPVGLKLMASWFGAHGRGFALGALVGALTLGSLLPHLFTGIFGQNWRAAMTAGAASSLLAATLAVILLRPGPYLTVGARPQAAQTLTAFRVVRPRLVNLSYLGHMWELYAVWAWSASWLVASRAVYDPGVTAGALAVLVLVAFGVLGAVGCLVAGWAGDRVGRAPVARVAVATSGLCCLLTPWAYSWPTWALAVFCGVWGATVIADSAMFSTLLSEVSDQRWVGTALTVQTACGFALTTVTISALPFVADLVGWRWTMLVLVPGPLLAVLTLTRLRRTDPAV